MFFLTALVAIQFFGSPLAWLQLPSLSLKCSAALVFLLLVLNLCHYSENPDTVGNIGQTLTSICALVFFSTLLPTC